MRRRGRVVGIVLALLVPRVAWADDEIDARSLEAERLAAEAHAEQERGAYAKAVELYLAAHEAQPAAIILYDIAVLYDARLGSPSLALAYYRRALASPDVDDEVSARALARVRALEEAAARASAPPEPEAPKRPPPPPPRAWHPLRIAGGGAAIAGALSLGATGVLALVAKSKDDEAAAFCDGDRCTDPRALELTDDAAGLARAANVTFGVGLSLVVSGVVLWLVAPSSRPAVDASGIRW